MEPHQQDEGTPVPQSNKKSALPEGQEKCFRAALEIMLTEGKLERGGDSSTIKNLKLIVQKLAAGNTYF